MTLPQPTNSLTLTTVTGKVVRATRYAEQESLIPGAKHWGWRVVEPARGVGLSPEEQMYVENELRRAEASRV